MSDKGEAGKGGQDQAGGGGGTGTAEGDKGTGGEGGGGGSKSRGGLTLDDAIGALADVRKEAADGRVANKAMRTELDDLKTGIGKALGLKGTDDDKADLKAVLAAVEGLTTKIAKADRKEAFAKVATKLGVDADLAFAYLTADGSLDDPEVDVEKLLKAAVKAKPQLKATTAQRVGVEPGGGEGGKTKNMNAFIRRAAGR